jgi:hypothetical protein
MNDEFERMWKEAEVASAQHLPIATEGNYDEPVKTAGLQAEI